MGCCGSSTAGVRDSVVPPAGPAALSDWLEKLLSSLERPALPVHTHAQRLESGKRGISLEGLRTLRTFYATHGGLEKVMGDVCKQESFKANVCNLTASTGLSLAESIVFVAKKERADSAAFIGFATTFFSYSWTGTKLGDMLEAVERQVIKLERADGKRRYVWIDMFAASQNLLAGRYMPSDAGAKAALKASDPADYAARKEDTDHIFDDALDAVGELLLYCSPLAAEWRAPPHPYLLADRGEPPDEWLRRGPGAMTRAWCMFEMVKCLAKGCELHVVLNAADVDGFEALLTQSFDEIAVIIAGLDARDAQISKVDDREYILGEVAKVDGGLRAVSAKVCASLREWLAAEGRAVLSRVPAGERGTSALLLSLGKLLQAQSKFGEAEPLFVEAVDGRRTALGDQHEGTLAAIHCLGGLLQDQGRFGEAQPLLEEALNGRRSTLGEHHVDTLQSRHSMATVLRNQGKLKEAEPLLQQALQGLREARGDRDAATLSAMSDLSRLLLDLNRRGESEPLCREALDGRRALLGARHPDTINSIKELGVMLKAQGKPEAEPLLVEALAARRETLGDQNKETLVAINHLAVFLQAQGKYAAAEPLLREALAGKRRTNGDAHKDTFNSINNLGLLLHLLGRLDEAEVLLREAHDGCRATLTEGHRTRLRATGWLADVLRERGEVDRARELLDENVLASARVSLGPTVDTTLMLEAIDARLRCAEGRSDGLEAFRAVLERMRAALGPSSPETLRCATALEEEETGRGRRDKSIFSSF